MLVEICLDRAADAWAEPLLPTNAPIIVVDNTAPTPPKEQDGEFLSSRHKGFGMGTQSVKDIAARYGVWRS